MFDRQRCGEKCKSLIPCFNLIEVINDGRLVISFVDVTAKQNRSNSFWKVVERRVGGHRFERQRCCLIPHNNYNTSSRVVGS